MAKYIMVVGSNPTPGDDAAYNKWYDEIHIPEVCAIPGVTGGARYESHGAAPGERPYLAIYELETEDPQAVMAELTSRAASGKLNMSPTIDVPNVQMAVYKAR
jgi:hypothetical protein